MSLGRRDSILWGWRWRPTGSRIAGQCIVYCHHKSVPRRRGSAHGSRTRTATGRMQPTRRRGGTSIARFGGIGTATNSINIQLDLCAVGRAAPTWYLLLLYSFHLCMQGSAKMSQVKNSDHPECKGLHWHWLLDKWGVTKLDLCEMKSDSHLL